MIACGRPISLQRYAQAHDRGDGRREKSGKQKEIADKDFRSYMVSHVIRLQGQAYGWLSAESPEVAA